MIVEASVVRHLMNAEEDIQLALKDAYSIGENRQLYEDIDSLLVTLRKLQIEAMNEGAKWKKW